jgi:phosphoglycolate phosphatase
MATNKPKLVIFDWDGTLSDSVARIAQCIQLAAQDHGLQEPSYAEVAEIVGLGLGEAILRLFPGATDQQSRQVQTSYSNHYRSQDQIPCPFFPTVTETLWELHRSGYLLAVATGKSRAGLNRVLEKLEIQSLFHGSRCADETLSKPHPLMLEQLLQEFAVTADEAVMVGDTEFDMEMAANAGMPSIAVSYGAHHVDRLRQYTPLACLDLFADIKAVI